MKVLLPIIWHELTHCVARAWEDAGHEVRVYDWRTDHKRKGRDAMLRTLIAEAERFKPDLCWMQIQAPNILTPAACALLKEHCGYLAHWSGDVRHPLPDWYLEVAPYVDCLLFSNMTDVDIVKRKGYPAAHLQIGYDPRLYYPGNEDRKGIVFIGNNYGGYKYAESESRRKLVQAMAEEFGRSFKVYGVSWEGVVPPRNCGGYVREPGDADILRRSLVALNWDHFHRPWFASDRLTRATACGCETVSQHYEGIEFEHPHTHNVLSIYDAVTAVKLIVEGKDGLYGSLSALHTKEHHTWDNRVYRMLDIMDEYPTKQ